MLVPASSFHSEREKGTKSDIGNWLIKKKKKVEHKKKELWQQSTLDAGIFTNFLNQKTRQERWWKIPL